MTHLPVTRRKWGGIAERLMVAGGLVEERTSTNSPDKGEGKT